MRTNNPELVAEIKSKFPGVEAVLQKLVKSTGETPKDNLFIKVEQLDSNSLELVPTFFDGREASLSVPGLVGRQYELFFAIDAEHKPTFRIGSFDCRQKNEDQVALRQLVNAALGNLRYVIRLTVGEWCSPLPLDFGYGKDDQLGDLCKRQIVLTVYKVRSEEELVSILGEGVCPEDNIRIHLTGFYSGLDGIKNPQVVQLLRRQSLRDLMLELEHLFLNGPRVPLLNRASEQPEGAGTLGAVQFKYSVPDIKSMSPTISMIFRKGNVAVGFRYYDAWVTSFLPQEPGWEDLNPFPRIEKTAADLEAVVYAGNFKDGFKKQQLTCWSGTFKEVSDLLAEVIAGLGQSLLSYE